MAEWEEAFCGTCRFRRNGDCRKNPRISDSGKGDARGKFNKVLDNDKACSEWKPEEIV